MYIYIFFGKHGSKTSKIGRPVNVFDPALGDGLTERDKSDDGEVRRCTPENYILVLGIRYSR